MDLKFIMDLMGFGFIAITILCVVLSLMINRVYDNVKRIEHNMNHMQRKSDAIYINQLYIARDELIKEERYEDADKINKIINEEIKRQKTE